MSPLFIIILMVSSVVLLLVLFFVIRKRQSAKQQEAPEQPPVVPPVQNSPPAAPESAASPESAIDLASLGDLNLNMLAEEKPNDVVDLVSRHRFFQGKNLETFESIFAENRWEDIERLILEKFQAQKKDNAEILAKEVAEKLQSLAAKPI